MKHLIDIASFLIGPEASIKDVMRLINRREAGHQFQIVVDDNRRILGTITDGDIRRAILRDIALDEPIHVCMQKEFKFGHAGRDQANRQQLQAVGSHVPFLPIVDDAGIIDSILLPAETALHEIRALVMAGGFGKRLAERTLNTPKPLLPVGDRPILAHVLDRLEAAGILDIRIAVHYLSDHIEQFVCRRASIGEIALIHEDQPLGTVGAVGLMSDFDFPGLLVLNGDVMTSLDYQSFVSFHMSQGYAATMAVAQHEIRIPYGVIDHAMDGSFEQIHEKPVITHLVSAGINILSPEICQLVPRNQAVDMPELIALGKQAGMKIGLFPIHEYWTDVGRPEDLARANDDHR
jgi:dTDP-glucose pyrophosphorylase